MSFGEEVFRISFSRLNRERGPVNDVCPSCTYVDETAANDLVGYCTRSFHCRIVQQEQTLLRMLLPGAGFALSLEGVL